MSKADEKTIELMKKAKDFIPDGGYSEKELNLAFFMFINGYHQAEKDNELTLEDVKTIDKLLNQCVDYRNPYQEVLKRFKEIKEQ